jgi:hypothetical protein
MKNILGDGKKIRFWHEFWLGESHLGLSMGDYSTYVARKSGRSLKCWREGGGTDKPDI